MKQNFLLGKGERLTDSIVMPPSGGPKEPPYTFHEARGRLTGRLSVASKEIGTLPPQACPNDLAVVSLTLNPEYIAKSYFPSELLREVGLTVVGSRPRRITPAQRSRGRKAEETVTTELFAVARRSTISEWSVNFGNWMPAERIQDELASIEDIAAPRPESKIKGAVSDGMAVMEVVMHTQSQSAQHDGIVIGGLQEYLEYLGMAFEFGNQFAAGGLMFVELDAPADAISDIAQFSLVRAVREMPRLRMLRPTIRASAVHPQPVTLPAEGAVDPNLKVAIFDGGVPDTHPVTSWVTPIDAPGVGAPVGDYLKHGVGVSSAFLFGHLNPKDPLPAPFANVDHYRVLDDEPGLDPHELYEVLSRIDSVLAKSSYQFVNISLGPQLPIEDDDVHAWTAVLDDRLSENDTLATIAVGNDGEGDATLGLNRVQVPADCVNALSIGACDTPSSGWARAPYSSVGPGRSPGLVKPDLVEFGGSTERPFLVLSEGDTPSFDPTGGTSFAAPSVLRMGAGVRAHFGDSLNMLAIRTLLIHQAETSDHSRLEIGWGRNARDISDIVLCDDDAVRIVYQGSINPAKYMRVQVPMPNKTIRGFVTIKATLCYKSHVDPHHPSNYTRAGLDVAFRPHDRKFKNARQAHPNTKSFFGDQVKGMTEEELRRDAAKWENCLHAVRRFRGSSLSKPCFDIHYNARTESGKSSSTKPLDYAMAITIQANHAVDLYDQIVREYATVLEPIRPTIEIPVRV